MAGLHLVFLLGPLFLLSSAQIIDEAYSKALNIKEDEELYYGTFPQGFLWASATSSYQVEGAWADDGKGESIWDRKVHTPGSIESDHTGDVACNSYYQYEEDVSCLVNLGVSHYRFSISWPRIQPTGEETTPNAAGIQYYNNLIDALLREGIEPMVTLYHWDLPQALQDQGGWLNESVIVPAFANYARHCFEAFGDRVRFWITINEPWIVAWFGYGNAAFAPGVYGPAKLGYEAAHSIIKGHAEAFHVYDDEFRQTQNGKIGITLNSGWAEPRNRSVASDVDAAMRDLDFGLGWFAHPIFVNGDYPDVMKFKVAEKSILQGFSQSRLPEFTPEEKTRVQGTSDFFGLNFYTSALIFHEDKPLTPPSYDNDKDTGAQMDPSWPDSGSGWLKVTPFGMRKLLAYIYNKYGHPEIIITENGMSDRNSSLQDDHRVYYYKYNINNVLQAIDLDGVDVIGYTAWALLDNFEWNTGYNEKFGLYYVDFEDPARPRVVKDSVDYYKQLIIDNGFIEPPVTVSPLKVH